GEEVVRRNTVASRLELIDLRLGDLKRFVLVRPLEPDDAHEDPGGGADRLNLAVVLGEFALSRESCAETIELILECRQVVVELSESLECRLMTTVDELNTLALVVGGSSLAQSRTDAEEPGAREQRDDDDDGDHGTEPTGSTVHG